MCDGVRWSEVSTPEPPSPAKGVTRAEPHPVTHSGPPPTQDTARFRLTTQAYSLSNWCSMRARSRGFMWPITGGTRCLNFLK